MFRATVLLGRMLAVRSEPSRTTQAPTAVNRGAPDRSTPLVSGAAKATAPPTAPANNAPTAAIAAPIRRQPHQTVTTPTASISGIIGHACTTVLVAPLGTNPRRWMTPSNSKLDRPIRPALIQLLKELIRVRAAPRDITVGPMIARHFERDDRSTTHSSVAEASFS